MPFPEYEVLSKFINENCRMIDVKNKNKYGRNIKNTVHNEHFLIYDNKIHEQCKKFGDCITLEDDDGNLTAVLVFVQLPGSDGNINQIKYISVKEDDETELNKLLEEFNKLNLSSIYYCDYSFLPKELSLFKQNKVIYHFIRPLNINGMIKENIKYPSRKINNEISNKKDELYYKIKKNDNVINKKISDEDLETTYNFVINCNSPFKPTFEFWKDWVKYYDYYLMTKNGIITNVYCMETHYLHFSGDKLNDNKHKADVVSVIFGNLENILDIVGSFKSCFAVYVSFNFQDIEKYKFYMMSNPSIIRSSGLEFNDGNFVIPML